ncbi:MAG: transporter, family, hexuronate transporter [Mycobacterium sp.]|nr:transporter, family, hexuronate transporter [Mycobacterium sp.]
MTDPSAPPRTTTLEPRTTRVRFRVFTMAFAADLLNYGVRVSISVAAPFILEEFDFSPFTWGLILSAFFWTYAPAALLGGIMADRIGVRRAYLIAMLIWSISLPLTASAWNFGAFMVARLLFGVGEGPMMPISTKITANWFPRRRTASMLNLIQSGTTVGPILATPFVVWMATTLGWRESFVILGALGLVWTIIWARVGRDNPAEHPKVSASELEYITADHNVGGAVTTEDSTSRAEFWKLLRSPYIAALAFGYFCYAWVLFMFLTWYPQYLVEARGVDKSDLAGIATIPWITATLGLVGGGLVAARLVCRTGSLVSARQFVVVVGLLGAGLSFGPSPFITSPTAGLVLLSTATFFLLASFQYQALIVAVTPSNYTGRAAGTIQLVASSAGMLAPIVTGAIVEVTGSYTPAFVVGGGLSICGALAVGIFGRTKWLRGAAQVPEPAKS